MYDLGPLHAKPKVMTLALISLKNKAAEWRLVSSTRV